MFFNEDHLRITKIRTIDGISPLMGEDERPQKKIIFAPLNPQTKKLFEEENSRKPNQLKMKIEVVRAYQPQTIPQVDEEKLAMQKKIAELEAKNAELVQNTKNIIDPVKESKTKTSVKPEKEVA